MLRNSGIVFTGVGAITNCTGGYADIQVFNRGHVQLKFKYNVALTFGGITLNAGRKVINRIRYLIQDRFSVINTLLSFIDIGNRLPKLFESRSLLRYIQLQLNYLIKSHINFVL